MLQVYINIPQQTAVAMNLRLFDYYSFNQCKVATTSSPVFVTFNENESSSPDDINYIRGNNHCQFGNDSRSTSGSNNGQHNPLPPENETFQVATYDLAPIVRPFSFMHVFNPLYFDNIDFFCIITMLKSYQAFLMERTSLLRQFPQRPLQTLAM